MTLATEAAERRIIRERCRIADAERAAGGGLMIAVFTPEQIAPGVKPQRGTVERWAWSRLVQFCMSPAVVADKASEGMKWSDYQAIIDEIEAAHRATAAARRAARQEHQVPPKRLRRRCGARCRDGHACRAPVVWDPKRRVLRARCRLHGGLSTGPRTAAGRERIAEAQRRRWAAWRAARAIDRAPGSDVVHPGDDAVEAHLGVPAPSDVHSPDGECTGLE